jgi:hypothetical protein
LCSGSPGIPPNHDGGWNGDPHYASAGHVGSAADSRLCAGFPDLEDNEFERFPVEVSLDPPLCKNTADLLHGFLRPDVIGSDPENYVIDKLKAWSNIRRFIFAL